MRYVIDYIPLSLLAHSRGVGFYIKELTKERFCEEVKEPATILMLAKKSSVIIVRKLCGVEVSIVAGDVEVRDHDTLIVIVNRDEWLKEEEVEKQVEMKWIRFYLVRARMTQLDNKCTGCGNNVDCYCLVCKDKVDAGGVISEALVFDI